MQNVYLDGLYWLVSGLQKDLALLYRLAAIAHCTQGAAFLCIATAVWPESGPTTMNCNPVARIIRGGGPCNKHSGRRIPSIT